MQPHLPPLHQTHHKEEFKADSTISKPYHISYHKGKGEDSEWTSSDAKRLSNQCSNHDQSKAHIPEPSVGVSQIPRDNVAEEGGDTEEEIKHFTSVLENTTQLSS